MGNKIWKVVLIISVILVGVSGFNVFRLAKEYWEGKNEYKELEQYVSMEEPAQNQLEYGQGSAGEKESQIPVSINVEYDKLKSINEDFAGWLYYEPLELSYPVVYGEDNDYYTAYTFEKEKNSSGAIFIDSFNMPDYSDYNTIIYGHNMRNGTMFGSLKKLLSEPDRIEGNPYFYIFTEDKAYMYEIFAVYITNAESHTYDLIEDEAAQEKNLEYIRKNAAWLSDKEVKPSDRILTLSTCYGLHSSSRTVVQGVLVVEEDR